MSRRVRNTAIAAVTQLNAIRRKGAWSALSSIAAECDANVTHKKLTSHVPFTRSP